MSSLAHQLWRTLIEPTTSGQSPEEQQQTRLLAALLVLLIPLLLLINGIWLVDTMNHSTWGTFYISVGALIGFALAYALNRSGRYWWAALITVQVINAACFAGVILEPNAHIGIAFLSLGALLAVALLPLRTAGFTMLGTLGGSLLLPLLLSEWTYRSILPDLSFLITIYFFIWMTMLVRRQDLLRIEQQSQQVMEAERVRLQLELEHQRMHILSDFITNASHEFRTPLSVINIKAYLLEKATEPPQRQRLSTEISRQVTQIVDLLDGLTTMTSLDSGTPFDVQALPLNHAAEQMQHEFQADCDALRLTLQLELDAVEPVINGDPLQLHRALKNILDNALRYTSPYGTITIRTFCDTTQAGIEIQDSGCGIASTDLPHIFNRFYRADVARSTRGLGLGLSIARKIVERHQGRIEVESAPHCGSTFRLIFPLR